jgi:hypothetical protein
MKPILRQNAIQSLNRTESFKGWVCQPFVVGCVAASAAGPLKKRRIVKRKISWADHLKRTANATKISVGDSPGTKDDF